MKKALFCLLVVALLFACVSCHKHTFSSDWSFDKDYHWHAATCGHANATSDKAKHTFDNLICSVCGYSKLVGNWHLDQDALNQAMDKMLETELESYAKQLNMSVDELRKSKEYGSTVSLLETQISTYKAYLSEELNKYFNIEFVDGKNVKIKIGDESAEGTYTISDNRILRVKVEGEEEAIGVFNEDFTLIDMTLSGGYSDGIVFYLSKD